MGRKNTMVLGRVTMVLGRSTMVLGSSTTVLGRSNMVSGRSTMVLAKSTMVLGRSTMVLGRSDHSLFGDMFVLVWRILAYEQRRQRQPPEYRAFQILVLSGVWQLLKPVYV